jgi:hypothetical protein
VNESREEAVGPPRYRYAPTFRLTEAVAEDEYVFLANVGKVTGGLRRENALVGITLAQFGIFNGTRPQKSAPVSK